MPVIREVLAEAIEAGGSSLRDYRQADGELGYFQHTFRVYDREGARLPHARLRGHDPPDRAVRPVDLLLPALSKMT